MKVKQEIQAANKAKKKVTNFINIFIEELSLCINKQGGILEQEDIPIFFDIIWEELGKEIKKVVLTYPFIKHFSKMIGLKEKN